MEDLNQQQKHQLNSRNRAEHDEVDLREIIGIIKAQKWFVVGVIAAVLFLAILYAIIVPPKYQTSALIQVENKTDTMSSMFKSMESFSGEKGKANNSEIETVLITSRYILQPAIQKLGLNLDIKPNYFPFWGRIVSAVHGHEDLAAPVWGLSSFAWGGERVRIEQFSAPDALLFLGTKFHLVVEEHNSYALYDKDWQLILHGKVGELAQSLPTSAIPGVALQMVELHANAGTHFTIVVRRMDKVLKTLGEELNVVDMGGTSTKLAGDNDTGVLNLTLMGKDQDILPRILNSILDYEVAKNIEKKSAETKQTLGFLQKQLGMFKKSLDLAETALSNYRAEHGSLGISVEGEVLLKQIVDVEQTFEQAKLKKLELLQDYTEQHPAVIVASEQVAKIHDELRSLENRVRALPKTEQEAVGLEREVATKDQLYMYLLNKIQEMQITEAGTLSDVYILMPASTAVKLPARMLLILFGSIFGGFMLAILIVFARRVLEHGVEDPDYVEEHLGIPVYANIPICKKQEELFREMRRGIPGKGPYILSAKYPLEIAVESLRSLRTTLQYILQEASNNIVTVLGAKPAIGKSFVSLNLAYVLADTGKSVLLIDADLREGKISTYLEQKKSPGLSEILEGRIVASRATKIVREKYLDFIATGEYPESPADLLFGNELPNLLADLSSKYDVVVIDTPPILAAADGIIIAKNAAMNLLLIDAAQPMREIEHTIGRLHKNDIRVRGLILNNTKQTQAYGYGQYHYGYGNNQSKDRKKNI